MTHIRLGAALVCLLLAQPALACGLDDCALSDHDHRDDPVLHAPDDAFAWMNHELAVARAELRRGHDASALRTARELDRVLRAQHEHLLGVRGSHRVQALHTAIVDLAHAAGGIALEPLPPAPILSVAAR